MADGIAGGIEIRKGIHLHGRQHHGVHACTHASVLQGQRIDAGGEHSHVVSAGAVHLDRSRYATPDVAGAYGNGDLHARLAALLENCHYAVDECKVQNTVFTGSGSESLTRKLEQNTVINGFLIHRSSPRIFGFILLYYISKKIYTDFL